MPLRTRREIGQVELENVVPLEHVGVALLDDRVEPFERGLLALGRVSRLDDDEFFKTRLVAHGNRHEMILRALGIGELVALRAKRLDVDLHPAQFGEIHPLKECPAAGREVLLHGIGQREMPHAAPLAQDVAHALEIPPARAPHQPVVRQPAGERFALDPLHLARRPDEGLETRGFHDRRRAFRRAAVDLHLVFPGEFHGHDAVGGVGTEQDAIFLEGHGKSGRGVNLINRPPQDGPILAICHPWGHSRPARQIRRPELKLSRRTFTSSPSLLYANTLAFDPSPGPPCCSRLVAAFRHGLPARGPSLDFRFAMGGARGRRSRRIPIRSWPPGASPPRDCAGSGCGNR